jgi:hypothetical protein
MRQSDAEFCLVLTGMLGSGGVSSVIDIIATESEVRMPKAMKRVRGHQHKLVMSDPNQFL